MKYRIVNNETGEIIDEHSPKMEHIFVRPDGMIVNIYNSKVNDLFEVQLFTTFQDVNKKDIYEGDVVRVGSVPENMFDGVIKQVDGKFKIYTLDTNYPLYILDRAVLDCMKIEIVFE